MSRVLRMARSRWPVVLVAVLGAALVLTASGRVWAEGVAQGLAGPADVTVTGREVQPVLPALALLAAAAAAALGIGGRLTRWFAAGSLTLAGAAVVLAAAARVADASRLAGSLEPAVSRVSGIRGEQARDVVVVWAWPWLTVAGGLLVAVAGLVALVAGGRWPDRAARYERSAEIGPATGPSTGPQTGPGGGPEEGAEDERPEPDAAAVWDALSRGEDPTAGRAGR